LCNGRSIGCSWQTKDDSNESNENSKVQPEKSLESTNQEKKDEIQKHATLATEETTTVNVSVASTSDISKCVCGIYFRYQ